MEIKLSRNIIKLIYQSLAYDRINRTIKSVKNKLLCEAVIPLLHNFTYSYKSMQCIKVLSGFKQAVYSIAMLQNGYIIIGSNDGLIRVYNTQANLFKELKQHNDSVYAILVLQNGDFLSRSWDAINLWSRENFTFRVLNGLFGDRRAIIQLSNENILSSSSDQMVNLWTEDKLIKSKKLDYTILRFKPLMNNHTAGLADDHLYIIDNELNIISSISQHVYTVLPLNQEVILCGRKSFVRLDLNYQRVEEINDQDTNEHTIMIENKIITVLNNDIIVWNPSNGFSLNRFNYPWLFEKIYAYKNDVFFTTSKDYIIRVWWYCNEEPILLTTLSGYEKDVNYIAGFDNTIVTASFEYTCKIWKSKFI
jgi:WD40 repeat protein